MKTIESILTNYSGSFPDAVAINSTGPATTDGSEYVADFINNYIASIPQIMLDYANVTPNGITESTANSQYIDALKKGFGVGPGVGVTWMNATDPATAGYRVLLLQGQGVLRSAYQDLDAVVYVGDPSNPTAPYFYHADDAAGTTRNTAGAYLILPPAVNTYQKQYSEAAGDFTLSGPAGWVTTFSESIPYRDADGKWRIKLNAAGIFTSASSGTITFSGVTFKTSSSNYAGIGIMVPTAATSLYANQGASFIDFSSSTSSTSILLYIDVPLQSEPTWSNGFAYQNAITY